MHNCDEQPLEYWCIAHMQETRVRCAKIESNNVTISDLPQFPSPALLSLFRFILFLNLSCLFHPSLHSFPLSLGTFIKAHYCTLLKHTIVHSLFTISTCDAPMTMYHHLRVLSFMLRAQKNLKGLSIVFYHLPYVHATLHDDVPSTTN